MATRAEGVFFYDSRCPAFLQDRAHYMHPLQGPHAPTLATGEQKALYDIAVVWGLQSEREERAQYRPGLPD